MAQVPVLVVNKLEIRERKLFLNHGCQFIWYRFCPMAYQDNEFVNVPCYATSWNLCIIALELCFFMHGLRLEVLLCPHRPVKMREVDKRYLCRASVHQRPSCRPSAVVVLRRKTINYINVLANSRQGVGKDLARSWQAQASYLSLHIAC